MEHSPRLFRGLDLVTQKGEQIYMGTINPYGKKVLTLKTDFCGRELSLEVHRVGFRTSASVLARYGDTVILGSAMVSPEVIAGMDYFPLSIDYEERFYAAGRISGSRFIKREGRPSDEEMTAPTYSGPTRRTSCRRSSRSGRW